MSTLTLDPTPSRLPKGLLAAAALGIAWNAFGVYRFAGTFTEAGRAAATAGLTSEQAAIYLGLPGWIDAVFAVGVFAGLAGAIALALRRRAALPLLVVSLVGYVGLFAGDALHGVFHAIPSQLAILATVLLIAAALLLAARLAARRGLLR